MTAREHHVLRAFGVLLLAIAALWPRSHATQQTNQASVVARHAIRVQYATTAARPSADDLPRPRNVRVVAEGAENDVDESQLRN